MLRTRVVATLALWACLCASVPALFAQTTAQISGRVTDSSGAVVPGVDVTLTQHRHRHRAERRDQRDAAPIVFPNLNPGPYRLEASLQGFRTFAQSDIVLQVGANLVIDPTLEVGELAETVEVRGGASQLQVELRAMAVSEVMEGERILELPLAARDATALITLSGAAVDVGAGAIGGTMTTGTAISVAGGQRMGVLLHARRRDAQQPLVRRQHADAVSRRPRGVPRQHQRAGSPDRPIVGRHGEPGDALGDERVSRHRVLVRPQRRVQCAAGNGARARSLEAEPAGRHASAVRSCATGCSSSAATRAPSNGAPVGDAFDRADRRDAGRRLDGVQPVLPPQLARSRTWPREGSIRPATAPQRSPSPQSCRRPENECGEMRWGARSERHDKQIVTRFDYQHNPTMSIFGRYLGTQHWTPLTYDESNLLTAGPTRSPRTTGRTSTASGTTGCSARTPSTPSASPTAGSLPTGIGAEFFNPRTSASTRRRRCRRLSSSASTATSVSAAGWPTPRRGRTSIRSPTTST